MSKQNIFDIDNNVMQGIGKYIDYMTGDDIGFGVLVFEMNSEDPRASYISNCNPRDMAEALRRYAAILDQRADQLEEENESTREVQDQTGSNENLH